MKRALILGMLVGVSAAVMTLRAQQATGGGRECGQGRGEAGRGRGPAFPPVSAPEKVAVVRGEGLTRG